MSFFGKKQKGQKGKEQPSTPAQQPTGSGEAPAPSKTRQTQDLLSFPFDADDPRALRRQLRDSANPYNAIAESDDEESTDAEARNVVREGTTTAEQQVGDTPGTTETDYMATVRTVTTNRGVIQQSKTPATFATPYKVREEKGVPSENDGNEDSQELRERQLRTDASITGLQATASSTDSRLSKMESQMSAMTDMLAAISQQLQSRGSGYPPPKDDSGNRQRSDSSIPSATSTPKRQENGNSNGSDDEIAPDRALESIFIELQGRTGIYEATIDKFADLSYIADSLPMAKIIRETCKRVGRSFHHNLPIYAVKLTFQHQSKWEAQQTIFVAIGNEPDSPDCLLIAAKALQLAGQKHDNRDDSSAALSFNTGRNSPPKAAAEKGQAERPDNVAATHLHMSPQPKVDRVAPQFETQPPTHGAQDAADSGTQRTQGSNDANLMAWNYSLRPTSPRFPIVVHHKEMPLTVMSTTAGYVENPISLSSGFLPSDPQSLYRMRSTAAEAITAYFKKATIPKHGLPDMYEFLLNVLEPLSIQFAATPMDKKADILYPSVYGCMTMEWRLLIHSLIGLATSAAEDIQLIQNRIASDNSLLFSILVHAMPARPTLGFVCKGFFNLSDSEHAAYNSAYQFPNLDDYTKIPGWFLRLGTRLALFLDFAVYAKEDLPFVAKAGNTINDITSSMTYPWFPFRSSDAKIDYRRQLCVTLPLNAFFAHLLWQADIFAKPLESMNDLFATITRASTVVSDFARSRYLHSLGTMERMTIRHRDFTFNYYGRVATYTTETSNIYSDSLGEFFEFFKSYFCAGHNLRLSRLQDTTATFIKDVAKSSSSQPLPAVKPSPGQKGLSLTSDYIPNDQFQKLTKQQQAEFIARRNVARAVAQSTSPTPQARAGNRVSFDTREQRMAPQAAARATSPTPDDRSPRVSRQEYQSKSPEDRAKIAAAVKQYNTTARTIRQSQSPPPPTTTVKASALPQHPAGRDAPNFRKDGQPKTQQPGAAYMADVEKLASRLAKVHPDFKDHYNGIVDPDDGGILSEDEEYKDPIDVLAAELAELDEYYDNVEHFSAQALLTEADDVAYYDAKEDADEEDTGWF